MYHPYLNTGKGQGGASGEQPSDAKHRPEPQQVEAAQQMPERVAHEGIQRHVQRLVRRPQHFRSAEPLFPSLSISRNTVPFTNNTNVSEWAHTLISLISVSSEVFRRYI